MEIHEKNSFNLTLKITDYKIANYKDRCIIFRKTAWNSIITWTLKHTLPKNHHENFVKKNGKNDIRNSQEIHKKFIRNS